MKIAIVGCGFTGLAAASDLAHAGHEVTVFEASDQPGGLAAGWQESDWQWNLEYHYHHIFSSDQAILGWVDELGLMDRVFYRSVKTSMRYDSQQFPLDSPMSLLKCPVLSIKSKVRTAATLAYLKLTTDWQRLEKIRAKTFIRRTMGDEAWKVLWEPLFVGKFANHADQINAAWFWARIHVRSSKLGYFTGGFGQLAQAIVEKLQTQGVEFQFSTPVERIDQNQNQLTLSIRPLKEKAKKLNFEQVLVTVPSSRFLSLIPSLPTTYVEAINQLTGIGAMTLVLELNQPFFADDTYWLNINEADWPFLAVVEHTNMAPAEMYGGKHLLYVGKYLDSNSKQYAMKTQDILRLYDPYLTKLSAKYSRHIQRSWLYKTAFGQPLTFVNHSQKLPQFATPVANLFWCGMQHVYPYDRGTNYAVEWGRRVAQSMMEEKT